MNTPFVLMVLINSIAAPSTVPSQMVSKSTTLVMQEFKSFETCKKAVERLNNKPGIYFADCVEK